ncbi:MAG: DNA polymerase I [Bacteroidales bacterium]
MTKEKKLFLLDAYALIFRAYYAFISNPMTNSKGMPTSTVFGFTLALEELLRKEKPSHVAVVFDPPGPTFRNDLYKEYKANRDATPEDIKQAVPYIKKLIEGFNIPVIEEPGYEADDVIGTMAKKAEKEGYTVYMMTPDKDFAQLVSEHIFMYKPARGGGAPEIMGLQEVKDKFLVEQPDQVIDILALWGDTSDNIPGARGIGEKTAKKLVAQYKTVEGVYAHIEDLKGKQKENLLNSREEVMLSKELAKIVLDVPVAVSPDSLIRREMQQDMLRDLFNELEFRTLSARILNQPAEKESTGSEPVSGKPQEDTGAQGTLFETGPAGEGGHDPEHPYENIGSVDHRYKLVQDMEGVEELASLLSATEAFCFDTETTSLNTLEAEVVGIAFSWKAHEAWYVPFSEDRRETLTKLNKLAVPLRNPSIEKIGQNLKYDLHILKNYGIEVEGKLFDTMIAHFLIKPDEKHNLNILAENYLGYSMVKIETLIGEKGSEQRSFRSVDPENAKEYAGEDADVTFQLALLFKEQLANSEFRELAENIEMPLIPVLMEMEHHGVRLDVKVLERFSEEIREEVVLIESEIHQMAGTTFNIGSPKQLGEVLFEQMKIISDPKKTRTKQYATGEEVLIRLKDKHPIIDKILEFRSLKKLQSTYVDALPKMVNQRTGRLHTSFNQAQVTTGRLSSNNPNLQNIPIREERGREIRKAFIPDGDGNLFLSADYSQIELRLMAHLSNDPQMIEAFVHEEDIHTSTAAKIFKVKPEAVTREMRSQAKTANFGIIYGISAFGLSQRMQISRTEARQLIDGYFETYPGVKAYMNECIRKAREQGYVETMYGRRRYLPDILSRNSVVRGNAERNAINTPLQGSAADVIKIAMVKIYEAIREKGMQSAMILQVHDELDFDVVPAELEALKTMVKEKMEGAVSLKVPLTVDMGTGANWLEAH